MDSNNVDIMVRLGKIEDKLKGLENRHISLAEDVRCSGERSLMTKTALCHAAIEDLRGDFEGFKEATTEYQAKARARVTQYLIAGITALAAILAAIIQAKMSVP